LVALKSIYKGDNSGNAEAAVLKKLDHKNIIKLIEGYECG
jgi:hypothetical protein